jgi:hypothetical protein
LLLGIILEIFHDWIDAKHGVFGFLGRQVHDNTIVSSMIADPQFNVLPATIGGSDPVLIDVFD